MTYMGNNHYLVVKDNKVFQPGARLLRYSVDDSLTSSAKAISVTDWVHHHGDANDLESVCKLPGTESEYLVAEAGTWKGKFGRIFRINVSQDTATVKVVYHSPIYHGSDEKSEGNNYEGMACFALEGQTYVMLGDRGGSARYPDGVLRLGKLSDKDDTIHWEPPESFAFVVKSPKDWTTAENTRSISDLYIGPDFVIWATATEDGGDTGPFNSLIYAVGKLVLEEGGITIKPTSEQSWFVAGHKVESLAAPPAVRDEAKFSYGTEDEDLGGKWGVLPVKTNVVK